MHELSIISSVLETCQVEATKSGAVRITKICLSIGEKSGVQTESLHFAFKAASPGTLAAQAELAINIVPFEGECTSCGHRYRSEEGFQICQKCGGIAKIISGQELAIDYIEVDD